MTGTTHKAAGVLAALVIQQQLEIDGTDSFVLLAGAVFGSLMPDIDNVHSSIGKSFPVAEFLVHSCQKLIRILSYLFPRKAGKKIRSCIGHRGLLHSLLLPALLLVPLLFWGKHRSILVYAVSGMLIGILSHLLLDSLSGGVPLFMPVSLVRIRLASIHTGGVIEGVLRIGLLGEIVYFWGMNI